MSDLTLFAEYVESLDESGHPPLSPEAQARIWQRVEQGIMAEIEIARLLEVPPLRPVYPDPGPPVWIGMAAGVLAMLAMAGLVVACRWVAGW